MSNVRGLVVPRRLALARPRQLGRRSWRFVFTPDPKAGISSKLTGILGCYFKWRPQRDYQRVYSSAGLSSEHSSSLPDC